MLTELYERKDIYAMKKIHIILFISIIAVAIGLYNHFAKKQVVDKEICLKSIELKSEPDAIFTSVCSDKIVACSEGKLDIYNSDGDCYRLETEMNIVNVYPAQETLWIVDDKMDLYEISYDGSRISDCFLTNIQYITGYYDSYAAITTSGELYVWGNNIDCRLGIDGVDYIDEPIQIKNINGVKKVVIGNKYSLLLTQSGEVYECGEICIENVDNQILETHETEFVK